MKTFHTLSDPRAAVLEVALPFSEVCVDYSLERRYEINEL